MSKNGYDSKVIILDLDFFEIEQYVLDDVLFTKKILSELSSHQNLIILTNNHKLIASKSINDLNLKSGYLITDSGSTTTNMSTKNIIDEGEIDKELCIRICHKCIGLNLCFILFTKDTKYPYRTTHGIIRKYKTGHQSLYDCVTNSLSTNQELKNCINNNKISKIEVLFLERQDSLRNESMRRFIQMGVHEPLGFSIGYSSLHIVANKFKKIESIRRLSEERNGNINTDGIYIGVNQFELDVACSSKISVTTNEINKGMKNEVREETDLIPGGERAGLDGLKENSHIGLGDGTESLNKRLEKVKKYFVYKKELDDFSANKVSYLTFMREIKNEIESVRINFGKEQIPDVLEFIHKNKIVYQ